MLKLSRTLTSTNIESLHVTSPSNHSAVATLIMVW